ncbi:N-acetylmuramoyl-L-alanine amidase [Calothrix sp. UHCC 0171]|uniref:N-acetylmuramoyl-L-alanine amidase n=1 Tax=Calothrix sp. UHCC 0171 TaxID=3110245 RepID=UPI002B1F989F|nr:N-acetylmuramoyl-L-alanine amidase [Calothrix sp. UHCC 0171]MEA5573928.1 N-acetylmuramoyl-L-alanine amidase [Calothrix sp. UHCC 0171]
MKPLLGLILLGSILTPSVVLAQKQTLKVVYPSSKHTTSADRIFFIGTAPPTGQVSINGKPIIRSQSGHFAPSMPLQLGTNNFTIRYENQELLIQVTRNSLQPENPPGLAFVKDSLIPSVDMARMPGEPICFSAIAAANASVAVKLGKDAIALAPQPISALLPDNKAALTGLNQPLSQNQVTRNKISNYAGCTTVQTPGDLGQPQFQLTLNGKTVTQAGTGKVQILAPSQLEVVEVNVDAGVARTGSSTDHSRLTPLPKGTRTAITGRDGDWLRLDYGGWINSKETRTIPGAIAPRSIIRSIGYRQSQDKVEVIFPLQVPVPVTVQQGNQSLLLTLHNTTAQTDTFRTDNNPIISRLDWQQLNPNQVQYIFNLKHNQQWGYKLRYEGTSLVLTLRYPPELPRQKQKPLSGIKILLDPGHGGKESGASGPNGTLEKDVNLTVSKLLREELSKRGATVVMSREEDKDLSLADRQKLIDNEEPAIALSVHYNALPDDGDAENTQGIGMFWYNPQAHNLATHLHNYIVAKLKRPSYGIFWNNLALTRPTSAPSVLMELGFMSNPNEFEWVTNPKEQKKLANAIADGIVAWFQQNQRSHGK